MKSENRRRDKAEVSRRCVRAALWPRSQETTADRRRLRGAGDALARAEAYERAADARRREEALRTAFEAFAGAEEARDVVRITVDAARAAMGTPAAIVERATGKRVGGDAAVERRATDRLAGFALAHGLELRLPGEGIEAAERDWLEQLATAARRALARAEQAARLREGRELLGSALEAMPAPVVVQDAGGALVASSAAFRVLGIELPPPGETGQPFELCTLDPPRYFVAASAALTGGRRLTFYREVTQEREALRAKDELIATMGHELRTPLTSVRGYSQMMGRHLDIVREQIGRLDAMIQDFMDTALLPGGRLPVHRETLDPAELVHEAAIRFRGSWEDRELRLAVGPAPPVAGDAERLGQVLDNLLSNAVKYSSPGTPIELSVGASGGQVLFSVRDSGEGIAREHLERLFERSYRVPGRSTPGQGLGLAIVRDLVGAHGGEVWAESDGPGAGSTFVVSLPAAPPEAVPEAG